jgi:hypothetical protein
MSRDEILALKPGLELNKQVAVDVMGHVVVEDATFGCMERFFSNGETIWGPVEPYSEDMSVVERVIERMIELGFEDVSCGVDFADGVCTKPEAICKNALLNILAR